MYFGHVERALVRPRRRTRGAASGRGSRSVEFFVIPTYLQVLPGARGLRGHAARSSGAGRRGRGLAAPTPVRSGAAELAEVGVRSPRSATPSAGGSSARPMRSSRRRPPPPCATASRPVLCLGEADRVERRMPRPRRAPAARRARRRARRPDHRRLRARVGDRGARARTRRAHRAVASDSAPSRRARRPRRQHRHLRRLRRARACSPSSATPSTGSSSAGSRTTPTRSPRCSTRRPSSPDPEG